MDMWYIVLGSVILVLFAGSAGFSLLCFKWKRKHDQEVCARLDRKKAQQNLSRAYQELDKSFTEVGWKLNRSFLFPSDIRLCIKHRLVSGAVIRILFSTGLNQIGITLQFPVPKIPLGWKPQCLEDKIEKELLLAPVIKAQPYSMVQHADTSWSLIGEQIIEAVQTYERDWLAIKDQIPLVHRRIAKAAKEREMVEIRFKRDLDRMTKPSPAKPKSAEADSLVSSEDTLSLPDLDG